MSYTRPRVEAVPVQHLLVAKSVIPTKDPTRTIITDNVILRGAKFGPFPGKDAVEAKYSDWMQYVTCVEDLDESNLMIFIYEDQLFFYCVKSIHPGMELLVWAGEKKLQFSDSSEWTKQVRKEHIMTFPCQYCSVSYSTHYGLRVHWNLTHRPREGRLPKMHCKCPYCPQIIAQRRNLHAHIQRHMAVKTANYKYCPKKYRFDQWKEDSLKKNACNFLKKTYKDKYQEKRLEIKSEIETEDRELDEESSVVIPEVILEETDESDLLDTSAAMFKESEEEYDRYRKFKCPQCPKKFLRQGHVERHVMAIHNKSKALQKTIMNVVVNKDKFVEGSRKIFRCARCFDRFTHRIHLLSHHKQFHSGANAYRCGICNKSFCSATSCSRHVRTVHSSERPFSCSVCKKTCARSDYIKDHILHKHNGQGHVVSVRSRFKALRDP